MSKALNEEERNAKRYDKRQRCNSFYRSTIKNFSNGSRKDSVRQVGKMKTSTTGACTFSPKRGRTILRNTDIRIESSNSLSFEVYLSSSVSEEKSCFEDRADNGKAGWTLE